MQEQALENTPQAQMDGDKAISMLNRQPPISKIAPVQMVNQDKVYNDERNLAHVLPHGED